MAPQPPRFNLRIWKNLETAVRQLSKKEKTLKPMY